MARSSDTMTASVRRVSGLKNDPVRLLRKNIGIRVMTSMN
jgi:hypothetical protein